MGVYAGDTGYDNGIFSTGVHDSLSEAIQAVKKGLAECWCEPYWGGRSSTYQLVRESQLI